MKRGSNAAIMVGSPQQPRKFSSNRDNFTGFVSPIRRPDLLGLSSGKPVDNPLYLVVRSQEKLISTLQKSLEEKERIILQQQSDILSLKSCQKPPNNLKTNSAKKRKIAEENATSTSKVLDVPKFREHHLTKLSAREARSKEAIEEETFLKRHNKCELEEKKMIRRDLMRQRDIEMLKKLQESPRYACYSSGILQKKPEPVKKEEDEGSKAFDPDKIEAIKVVATLPKSVTVCG